MRIRITMSSSVYTDDCVSQYQTFTLNFDLVEWSWIFKGWPIYMDIG